MFQIPELWRILRQVCTHTPQKGCKEGFKNLLSLPMNTQLHAIAVCVCILVCVCHWQKSSSAVSMSLICVRMWCGSRQAGWSCFVETRNESPSQIRHPQFRVDLMHQVRDLFVTDRRVQHQPTRAFPYSHLSSPQDCSRISEMTEWDCKDGYPLS